MFVVVNTRLIANTSFNANTSLIANMFSLRRRSEILREK